MRHAALAFLPFFLAFFPAALLGRPVHAEDGVVVHLRADSGAVQIVRIDGDRPEVVCAGLCDRPLPREGVYQIGGDGVPRTRPFMLNEQGTDLTLRVDAGSSARRVAGGVAAVTGGAALIFSFLYVTAENLGQIASCSAPAAC